MKKIIVTGGCGFIGSNFIDYVNELNCDYSFVVIDNLSLGKKDDIKTPVKDVLIYDVSSDFNGLLKATEGAYGIVHLAADTRVIDSVINPLKNFSSNVIGTFNLLEAARINKVNKFIFASTGGAIMGNVAPPVHELMVPNPKSPYGASKLFGEGYLSAYAESYALNATSLRFSNVYGPRSYNKGSIVAHIMKSILKGNTVEIFGDGTQTRDYIYIDDICCGILKALESSVGGVYQLGTGVGTELNTLIESIKMVIGDYKLNIHYKDFRQGEVHSTYSDIAKAKNILNFNPDTKLEFGLKSTWDWFLLNKDKI